MKAELDMPYCARFVRALTTNWAYGGSRNIVATRLDCRMSAVPAPRFLLLATAPDFRAIRGARRENRAARLRNDNDAGRHNNLRSSISETVLGSNRCSLFCRLLYCFVAVGPFADLFIVS